MTKEDILKALAKNDFLNRDAEIAKRFVRKKDCAEKITSEDVLAIFKKLGYTAKYKKGERTYSVTEKASESISLKLGLEIKYSAIDYGFVVYENSSYLYGGPSLVLERDLTGDLDYRTGRPAFSDREEFEIILSVILGMYRDLLEEIQKNKDSLDALYGVR